MLFVSKIATMKVTLFSKEDIDIMFTTFDLTNRGYVTRQQYVKGIVPPPHLCV